MYIVIVNTENNRVSKFAPFDNLADADNHVSQYGGFVYNNTNDWRISDLFIDELNNVTNQPPVIDYNSLDLQNLNALLLSDGSIQRGIAELTLQRTNQIANKVNGIMGAIQAASSLAEIKTAIAALGDLPIYSASDFKDAVVAKMRNP